MFPFSVLFIKFAFTAKKRIFLKFFCEFPKNLCIEVEN